MDKSFKGIYSYFLWQQLIINGCGSWWTGKVKCYSNRALLGKGKLCSFGFLFEIDHGTKRRFFFMTFKDCLNVKIACGHHSFMLEDPRFYPSIILCL